jgi:hypothetical protein
MRAAHSRAASVLRGAFSRRQMVDCEASARSGARGVGDVTSQIRLENILGRHPYRGADGHSAAKDFAHMHCGARLDGETR